MSKLRLLLDEDRQAGSLAAALRQHGLDTPTTNEAGWRGADDETQLREATALGRAIVTNNIRDFVPLHTHWLATAQPPHAGIVVFPQQEFSVGEVVRRLANLTRSLTAEEMKNRPEWLHGWGAS